jgi:two-component system alkaline phosphatase synthesis response regulator PhoP
MIYYVEDDDNIRDLTVYALRKQGIEAEGFSCDGEFKAAVARRVPDAVLLDIMLPDTDGLAIMRRLRADRLTAHHDAYRQGHRTRQGDGARWRCRRLPD